MGKFGEYLKELREASGFTKTALAQKVGCSAPYLFDIEEGRKRPPTLEKCAAISSALSLTAPDKDKLISLALSERAPDEIKEFLRNAIANASPAKEAIDSNAPMTKVPLLGDCPAGDKTIVESNIEKWIFMPREITEGKKIYLLRVCGDSMIGDGIKKGDVVIVDSSAEPKSGDIIVARVDDECTIKRLYKVGKSIALHPSNHAHTPIEITEKNKFEYHGVVIGVLWKGIRKP